MIVDTDKTNRISVMKGTTYITSMKEHHQFDKEIDKKQLNKIERTLNKHSKSTVRIFNVAAENGQFKRALRNATVHVDGQISVLKGKEKDHKISDDGSIKMRPVLDAMEGPKKTICDIYSDIIHGIIESKDDDVLCYSTEELLAAIEEYNDKIERTGEVPQQKRIIGSMDANLYKFES